MLTAFVYAHGQVRSFEHFDPEWLDPDEPITFWIDLADPTEAEGRILSEFFSFHELAVEDALAAIHHPKVEEYRGFLFVILHGIDFEESQHRFATHDVDFFLGHNFLVTVHDGTSRSIQRMHMVCNRNQRALDEGPAALMHRIVDAMVDNYRPEVEKLEARLEALENTVLSDVRARVVPEVLSLKRDITNLRRVTGPQRDVVARLARREFDLIGENVAYRFRDVYDHLVRMAEEALVFQDRITALLDAHLNQASNRLNEVMKVLAVFASIFGPLTVLTSLYGMNVQLPHLPGGETVQFWWIIGMMVGITAAMLWMFRRLRWL